MIKNRRTPLQRTRRAVVAAVLLTSCIAVTTTPALTQVATPRVTTHEEQTSGSDRMVALHAAFSGANWRIGMAAVCSNGRASVSAYLGPFPGRGRPVQLAVRTPAGRIERFGNVVRGSPAAGFHSPEVDDPADLQRFLETALENDALISNGYNSFFNNAGATAAQRFAATIRNCR